MQETILETKKFNVEAFRVTHRGPGNFGFIFQEHARRPFLADKAAALGVPQGPVRRDLAQGLPVTLADGRVIDPDQELFVRRRAGRSARVECFARLRRCGSVRTSGTDPGQR